MRRPAFSLWLILAGLFAVASLAAMRSCAVPAADVDAAARVGGAMPAKQPGSAAASAITTASGVRVKLLAFGSIPISVPPPVETTRPAKPPQPRAPAVQPPAPQSPLRPPGGRDRDGRSLSLDLAQVPTEAYIAAMERLGAAFLALDAKGAPAGVIDWRRETVAPLESLVASRFALSSPYVIDDGPLMERLRGFAPAWLVPGGLALLLPRGTNNRLWGALDTRLAEREETLAGTPSIQGHYEERAGGLVVVITAAHSRGRTTPYSLDPPLRVSLPP